MGFFSLQFNFVFQKRPIHFAVESFDPDNLAALLVDHNVNVDFKYATLTPINFLAEQISDSKFSSIYRCMRLLVDYGADLNIPSWCEDTPIINILKNEHLSTSFKKSIVIYLVKNGDVDIDTHRNGEARLLLTELLPDLELLPVRVQRDHQWDFNRLITCLKNEEEAKFLRGINSIFQATFCPPFPWHSTYYYMNHQSHREQLRQMTTLKISGMRVNSVRILYLYWKHSLWQPVNSK